MIPSVRFLFPFTVVMVIGLYHVTNVQSAATSGVESSLAHKRSTGNGKVEEIKRKLVAAMLKKRHERKSLLDDDEDDDDDDDNDDAESGSEMSSVDSEWIPGLTAIRRKFQSVVAKAAKRRQPEDRDYFEAIGIVPHRRSNTKTDSFQRQKKTRKLMIP